MISLRRQPVSAICRIISKVIAYFFLAGCPQHLAQRSILRFGQPAVADIVLRLTDAMRWIVLDDAGFDRVGQNAPEETNSARRRTYATGTFAFPRSFFVFTLTRFFRP
jgi:hypothetical protein